MEDVELNEGILLGMGNPLLDIQLVVDDKQIFEKYGLKENDAILASQQHMEMFDEIAAKNGALYIPGGATQNTMRVFQWIVKKPNCASFFGAVGKDKYSEILRKYISRAGVNARYQVNAECKTGTCAVILYRHNRSLIADLGAANTFSVAHFDIPDNYALVQEAKFYYISGFFLTSCPSAILRIAKEAFENNKTFMLNLAAPFICSGFSEQIRELLQYIDILFGNDSETLEFARSLNIVTQNLEEIALTISALLKATGRRIFVVTRGSDSILVVQDGKITTFDVPQLHSKKIVDTNGAGDAFCGGFIAELTRGRSIERCISAGCFAASVIIQNEGCTFPEICEYKF